MSLYRIEDYYLDYEKRLFDGHSIKGTKVYALDDKNNKTEKVGSVYTLLVDAEGHIRYLVVETGFWIFGKRILLPMGRIVDDPQRDRIYVTNLTKEQVMNLPTYDDSTVVDRSYEEQLRDIYYMQPVSESAPVETSVPVEQDRIKGYAAAVPLIPTSDKADRFYERDPELYSITDRNHRLRLYEEKLVAEKRREKTGQVTVTKKVETSQAETSVPIQKEKIVIEIESVAGATQVNMPDGSISDGNANRIDIYEERPEIRKEAVVRQEINIRKEVDEEVITARESVRREFLNVQKTGDPDVTER